MHTQAFTPRPANSAVITQVPALPTLPTLPGTAPDAPCRGLDDIFQEMQSCQREAPQPPTLTPELREACRVAVNEAYALNDISHPAVAELRRLSLARATRLCSAGMFVPQPILGPDELYPDLNPDSWDRPLFPEEMLRQAVDLTPAPAAARRLVAELDNPRSGPGRLAEIIDQHPHLSDLLLALANSQAYALPSPVQTTQRAVIFLGYRELRALILGLDGLIQFRGQDESEADPFIWRRALACGFASRMLAARLGLRGGRYVAAGLLHDAGRFIMRQTLPRHATQAARMALGSVTGLSECEREIMGVDGPTLGGRLLARWQMPEPLAELVALRNTPREAEDDRAASLLHVAALAARALDAGQPGALRLPTLDTQAWTRTGLRQHDLAETFMAASEELEGVSPLLSR